VKTIWRKLIVTALGTGYLPASGTWGSLVTVIIFLLTAWACGLGASSKFPLGAATVNIVMVVTAVLASVACVALGDFTERTWHKKDPKYCTIDEVAGQAVSLLALPIGGDPHSWFVTAGVGFFLFRFFDVVKPSPARRFERLPKGWGVLLDDLMAGVYANLTAQLALRLVLTGA